MRKFNALATALLLTFVVAAFFTATKNAVHSESVIIARVIDGDTLQAQDGRIIRLLNINAPEKDHSAAAQATIFLKMFENQSLRIEKEGEDKYQRTLARLYQDSVYINQELVEQGLASKFLVEESEKKVFAKAEAYAIEKELGIWEHALEWSCFRAKIDFQAEIVFLKNVCSPINIDGWVLKDESRKEFKFPSINLGTINIHSGKGIDTDTDVYWQSSTSIWNNDRDTLYLFDEQGRIVLAQPYGY